MYKLVFILFLSVQLKMYGKAPANFCDPDSLSTFEFKWSNDFPYNTDYYYTNGLAFEIITPWAKENPINSILFSFKRSEFELFSFTLIHDIFTPKEKFNVETQLDGDRPYAACILLGSKKATYDRGSRIRTYSELQFGVLGPAAQGKEIQNGIHKNLLSSAQVVGWENQISNSLMINYSASIEKKFYTNNWFEFSGISAAQLGLPYTNLNVGLQTRIGFFDQLPKDFEFLSSQKWQIYLTLSASGRFVGYNATLQGGLFTESIYTLSSINRFVGYGNIGLTLIYKKFEMEYVQHSNTPEFPGAVYHTWGSLLIKFAF